MDLSASSGRFRVKLTGECVAALKELGAAYVEVSVDGSPVGRSRVGAVPYALQALLEVGHPGAPGVTWSLDAKYCGSSPASYDGNIGGYRRARDLCTQVPTCGPGAHMCTGEEAVRSHTVGIEMPEGWVSVPGQAARYTTETPIASQGANDCSGWTASSPANSGGFWSSQPTYAYVAGTGCTELHPILCCR